MRAERYTTHEKAIVEFYSRPGTMTADVVNLSTSGACLEWHLDEHYNLQNGDLIRVTIQLSSLKKQHFLTAEVVWAHEGRIGVNFVKPNELTARLMAKV